MTKKLLDKVVALLDPSDAEYMIAQDIIITILDEVKESILENHRNKCFKLDANFEIRKKVIGEVVDIIDNLRGNDE